VQVIEPAQRYVGLEVASDFPITCCIVSSQ